MKHQSTIRTTEGIINRVAMLRASGMAWEAIAEHVGRRVNTIKSYQKDYPELYRRYYDAAWHDICQECAVTAQAYLNSVVASTAEATKDRTDAAKAVLQNYQAQTATYIKVQHILTVDEHAEVVDKLVSEILNAVPMEYRDRVLRAVQATEAAGGQ